MKSHMTADAASFVASLRYEDIPAAAIGIGTRCVIDGLGLCVFGTTDEAVRILVSEARAQGGRADALLLGAGRRKVPVSIAARVLATAGHVHDWDDSQVSNDPRHQYGFLTHPTIPPLAVALAVSQTEREVTGRDFLMAFHAGFEVECKLSEWMPPDLYRRGFHSSGVVGTFAACATAAKLMRLTEDQIRQAFGIAVSLAAGLRANNGTMTKSLHVGRAAENGIFAATLALRGFTAIDDAFDGPRGFCQTYAGGILTEKLSQGFGGDQWSIVSPGVSVKPYASGILTHQTMDAMLDLMRDNGLSPTDVERIDCHAGSNILDPIRYAVAEDHLQAKFSMAALLAMMILRGRAGPREFSDDFIQDHATQDMQRRITMHLDPGIEAMGKNIIRSRIELKTRDGRSLSRWADERYRGGPLKPMGDAELDDKFRTCTDGILDQRRQRRVLRLARTLHAAPRAGMLAGAIQVGSVA